MSQSNGNNEEILQLVLEAESSLLPKKSKVKYEKCYLQFCDWRNIKNVQGANEDILIAYFVGKAKTLKASTLWSLYSMLRSTLQINENVDISVYKKLLAYLKRQNDGYVAKKSRVLSLDNVKEFLEKSPDDKFLFIKVVLVIALQGACRAEELRLLKVDDVEDCGNILVITLHDTKSKKKRVFTVTSEDGVNAIELYRKYLNLRPKNVDHRRLFIFYKQGKCTKQPVGINTFYSLPKKIAAYLGLPEPNSFTGHCFRRTSATFLADSGADILVLKRHGGWRSSAVAEAYVEDSIENKVKISKKILCSSSGGHSSISEISGHSSISETSTTTEATSEVVNSNLSLTALQSLSSSSGVIFNKLTNCSFIIYNNKQNE